MLINSSQTTPARLLTRLSLLPEFLALFTITSSARVLTKDHQSPTLYLKSEETSSTFEMGIFLQQSNNTKRRTDMGGRSKSGKNACDFHKIGKGYKATR